MIRWMTLGYTSRARPVYGETIGQTCCKWLLEPCRVAAYIGVKQAPLF